jgi:hypothetical protein
MNDSVVRGGGRYHEVFVAKLHCIRDALALGVRVDEFEAAVRVQGRSNVESLLCVKIPRPPSDGFCMNEDLATYRPQRHLVKVKGTLEILPSTDPWVEHGLPEEIEGQFSLWKQQVPEIRGKCGVHACQD